jgi:adenylylsulfate kinase
LKVGGLGDRNASGFIVWMTGMPCAGKTTLARGLQQEIAALAPTEMLDGDEMRKLLSPELGFSRRDRGLNVERIAQVARLLAKHGVAVIVACVSPYADMRSRAKEIAGAAGLAFLEVHVVAPPHILIARDTRQLYATALAGRLPGVTGPPDPYEVPVAPDITIDTGTDSVESSVARLLTFLRARALVEDARATP